MFEAQEALDMVKLLLTKALILVPLADGESLLLYIVATTQVVSAALVVEREEEGHTLKVQHPVYFISEVLSDSKTRYEEVASLLQVTFGDGRDVLPSRRGRPKPGCHRKNREVGTRADGSRHFVCPSDDHQVPSAH